MKKQKNRNNFVLKNKTDGGAFKDTMQNLRSKAIGKFDSLKNAVKNIKLTEKPLSYVAGETEINQLNEKLEFFKYMSYALNTIFIILIISFIIVISINIYNFRSNIISLQNTQKLCKDNIYENETARNKIYNLFSNKSTFTELKRALFYLALSILIVYLLNIRVLSILNIKYNSLEQYTNITWRQFIVDIVILCIIGLIAGLAVVMGWGNAIKEAATGAGVATGAFSRASANTVGTAVTGAGSATGAALTAAGDTTVAGVRSAADTVNFVPEIVNAGIPFGAGVAVGALAILIGTICFSGMVAVVLKLKLKSMGLNSAAAGPAGNFMARLRNGDWAAMKAGLIGLVVFVIMAAVAVAGWAAALGSTAARAAGRGNFAAAGAIDPAAAARAAGRGNFAAAGAAAREAEPNFSFLGKLNLSLIPQNNYFSIPVLGFIIYICIYNIINLKKNNQSVTDLFTSNFIIITILSIIIISGFYLYSNVFNKLYNIINDYSSKLTVIKNTIFTDENLNQLNLSKNRQTNPAQGETKTYGALVTLEQNILRKLLQNDNSGDVLNISDAYNRYNDLRQNDSGVDTLIGFIQFLRNTDDYNLLQNVVCGPTICDKGIGYHIKNLPDTNFTSFITDLQPISTFSHTNDIVKTAIVNYINKTASIPQTDQSKTTELWNTGISRQLDVIWPYVQKIINGDTTINIGDYYDNGSTINDDNRTYMNTYINITLLKDAFVEGVKAYNTELASRKTTFIDKVKAYDTELGNEISKLNDDDDMWKLIKNIKSKDDIQQCDCKGNPLNLLPNDKTKVLSILNYLATISNGDISGDVQNNIDYVQYYLIGIYSFILYILFHTVYSIFDKKFVVGGYFGILIIISIILVLISRIS